VRFERPHVLKIVAPRPATKRAREIDGTGLFASGLAGMGPAAFIIAIMGCGEGDAPCDQIRLLDTRYESQAACSAATDAALLRHGDADYPVVVARCVAAGASPMPLKADEVRLPEPARPPLRTAAVDRRR
jgi:hypothetical protein